MDGQQESMNVEVTRIERSRVQPSIPLVDMAFGREDGNVVSFEVAEG
jgi:hypothetical protein